MITYGKNAVLDISDGQTTYSFPLTDLALTIERVMAKDGQLLINLRRSVVYTGTIDMCLYRPARPPRRSTGARRRRDRIKPLTRR